MSETNRLIVVTNRLPVGIKKNAQGGFDMTKSSGGLVSAMSGLKIPFIWIGWVGGDFPPEEHDAIRTKLWDEFRSVPVFINRDVMEGYYDGYSNSVLWPLFHYDTNIDFRWDWYEQYENANRNFSDVLCNIFRPGDNVWIHDYHLFLLPRFFRDRIATTHSYQVSQSTKIGWFLHIPFPSSEIFRTLPQAMTLLEHVLACNVVGFHTYEYSRHFQHCCARMLGVDVSSNSIAYRRIRATVGVYPIGIELEPFVERCRDREVLAVVERLRATYGADHSIIISVDRLDPIKGVPLKLEGLRQFFRRHGHRRGKVTLLQIAVPSREGVQSYVELRSETERLVGEVNAQFGTIGHPNPVQYLFQSVSAASLTALYLASDICLITSVRDGMNLVCQEWLTCHAQRESVLQAPPGILILSEFVGAAHTLHGCLRVNPFDADAIADAIEAALVMPRTERAARFETQMRFVERHDANAWGVGFVAALDAAEVPEPRGGVPFATVAAQWRAAGSEGRHRLLVVRDSTIIEASRRTSRVGAIATARRMLRVLSASPCTTVVVVSWAGRGALVERFGDLNVWLAAEYGLYLRAPWWDTFVETQPAVVAASAGWRSGVLALVAGFAERTPGAQVYGRAPRATRRGAPRKARGDDDGALSAVVAFDCTSAERLFAQQIVRELQMHVTQTYGADVVADATAPGLLIVRPSALSMHAMLHTLARLGALQPAAVTVLAVNEHVEGITGMWMGGISNSPLADAGRAGAASAALVGALGVCTPRGAPITSTGRVDSAGKGDRDRGSFSTSGGDYIASSRTRAVPSDPSQRAIYEIAVGASEQALDWTHDVYFPTVGEFLSALQVRAMSYSSVLLSVFLLRIYLLTIYPCLPPPHAPRHWTPPPQSIRLPQPAAVADTTGEVSDETSDDELVPLTLPAQRA